MAIDQASSAQGRNMLPGSALEMQRGLRHPDRLQRASLLRAIRNDPDRALCVGQGDGWDIVDELIFLCEESKGTADRWDYVFTTLSLADERTVDLTKNEFLTTFDHRFLVMSARRLSQLPEAEKAGFFSPVIMESRETNRCRLCANVLAGRDLLETRVAIRVAAIADRPASVPALDADTLDAWVAELQGPYPQKVRKKLLQASADAVNILLSFWNRLPEPVRVWALLQGVEQGTAIYASRVKETIKREKEGELLRTALMCLKKMPPEHHDEALLEPMYGHGDPTIRAAAIAAGSVEIDCSSLLRHERSEIVRLAVIDRLERFKGTHYIDLVASLLEDNRWRVRARAVDLLVKLAPASLDVLRSLLSSTVEETRVAAIQALLRLDKDDWIAAALL